MRQNIDQTRKNSVFGQFLRSASIAKRAYIRAYFLKIKELECKENAKSKESEMKKLDSR